jgi:hypothetical protein
MCASNDIHDRRRSHYRRAHARQGPQEPAWVVGGLPLEIFVFVWKLDRCLVSSEDREQGLGRIYCNEGRAVQQSRLLSCDTRSSTARR